MNGSKALFSLTALLALFSFWINFTHHVSLLGGEDEGSYIACGKLLSEQLTFIFDDDVAEFGRRYLSAAALTVTGFRVYIEDSAPIQMVSGWAKGFSLLTVPFWWLDSDGGWKYLNPLAGALTLPVIFLIGTRLCGAFVGFSAALLLMTNFLQLWFSRYPMTEVVSQFLLLSMFLCVLTFYYGSRPFWLWVFAGLSSVAIVVHLGNIPLWALLCGVLCTLAAPYERCVERGDRWSGSLHFAGNGYHFNRAKLPAFISVASVAGGVPAVVAIAYWFLDPGIHRYTKLGSKMADATGLIERLVTAFLVRSENLALFLPMPLWILVGFGLFLVLRQRGQIRALWLIAVALAVLSFAFILFAGVGTPRVLYVARRNVPMVLPVICLLSGLGLEGLAARFQSALVGRMVQGLVLASIVGLQLFAFAPFADLNQGKGAPELAARIRAELVASKTGGPQLVLVPEVAASFVTGLRYVYNIPAVTYSAAVTPQIIEKMLEDGVAIYVLDIGRSLEEPLSSYHNLKLSFITSRDLLWTHMNQIGPTTFPVVSDRIVNRVSLFKVSRRSKNI